MFAWHKTKNRWIGIYGGFRAEIYKGPPPLHMLRWSVTVRDKRGSGATSSVVASKRAAETEAERLALQPFVKTE